MAAYIPLSPESGNVIGTAIERGEYQIGDFHQPAGPVEVYRRRQAVESFLDGSADPSDLTLQAYQEWAELDWKEPHGSYDMVIRLMGKILEEAGIELPNAWHDLERGRVDNQTEFRGEAGDALWCTVALASNAGVDVSEAVRQHLRTQYLHPEPRGPITFGRLQVALVDHVPTHGTDPRFLPEDADYEDYLPDVRDYLMWFSVTASMDLARQYGYGDYADARTLRQYLHELTNTTGPLAKDILGQWATILDEATGQPGVLEIRDKITTSYFREISDKYTVPLIGQAVVFLEHTVKGQGVSLGQIAVDNMRKLTGRVATNTVDKQDGPR